MPYFMDVHKLSDDVTAEKVQEAHKADLAVEGQYGVHYHGYYYNEDGRTVTCFAEGPSLDACIEVHRQAHGMAPDKIIEVPDGSLDVVMGDSAVSGDGDVRLPDGHQDSGIRILLVTELTNLTAVGSRLGDAAALHVVECHDRIVRAIVPRYRGREVQHLGTGVMLSFASASAAVQCAVDIVLQCAGAAHDDAPEAPSVRIGMAAGEPVSQRSTLFGAAVDQARELCRAAQAGEILVSEVVRDLCAGKPLSFGPTSELPVPGMDKPLTAMQALGGPESKLPLGPRPGDSFSTTAREDQRLAAALRGRYAVEGELGRGGMATVYLAHDLRHDRRVAIKVLRSEFAAFLGTQRFLQEIKLAARLAHPNIVPLYDSGEALGVVYYVMPHLEGETVREIITRERRLAVDRAVAIARGVAGAVDYAHRRNVIHRDIKPDNIFLHEGQPMVLDFGIALALSQAGGTRITGTGLSVGTPAYMSPEQAAGERNVDARTDVYALGCVLYEMLTGDPPFADGNLQSLVARIVTEEPAAVSTLRPDVPTGIADAVQRAMAKRPEDRFASAGEFAAALALH